MYIYIYITSQISLTYIDNTFHSSIAPQNSSGCPGPQGHFYPDDQPKLRKVPSIYNT